MPVPPGPAPVHAVAPIHAAPRRDTLSAQSVAPATPPPKSGFTTSDELALLSIVVSGLTLLFYLSSGFLNKRIELKARKFDKLCFEPVEACFKGLDTLFATSKSDYASAHKEAIAEGLSEVNYLLIQLKSIYPDLDFPGIEAHCDEFSELYFECKPSEHVSDYFAKYFYTKTQVLNKLFHYAIADHILFSLVKLPGKWWRRYREHRRVAKDKKATKKVERVETVSEA